MRVMLLLRPLPFRYPVISARLSSHTAGDNDVLWDRVEKEAEVNTPEEDYPLPKLTGIKGFSPISPSRRSGLCDVY
jgi:hypothetical protein